jgi:translation initiation factor 6
VGVFAACNDDVAIVPRGAPKKFIDLLAATLEVEVSEATIAGTTLLGSLVCLNSKGMLVTDDVSARELEVLEKSLDGRVNVAEIGHRLNAFGNTILANDFGALAHPDYEDDAIAVIEEVLDVKVRRARLSGSGLVGAGAVATNHAALLHPKSTPAEREEAKSSLGVPVDISTANHGCPYLRACVLVNAHGAVVGRDTTTVEIDRIQDTML